MNEIPWKHVRKRPITVTAYQWKKEMGEIGPVEMTADEDGCLCIPVVSTLEGNLHVSDGDWIICGVRGEFYPCKPDIFEQTYEVLP